MLTHRVSLMDRSQKRSPIAPSRKNWALTPSSVLSGLLIAGLVLFPPGISLSLATPVPAGTNLGAAINNNTYGYDLELQGDAIWTTPVAVNTSDRGNLSIEGNDHTVTVGNNTLLGIFNTNVRGGTLALNNINFSGTGLTSEVFINYGTSGSAANLLTHTLNLEGSTFNNIRTSRTPRGGILSIADGIEYLDLIVDGGTAGVTFSDNRNTWDSGVLNVGQNNNTVSLEGLVTFANNLAGNYGGAINIYEYNVALNLNGTTNFLGNRSIVYGGAVDIWGGASTTTFNGPTTFDGNFVYYYPEQDPAHVTDQHARGGALNIGAVGGSNITNVTFANTVDFLNNYVVNTGTASNARDAYGGAISLYGNNATRYYNLYFEGPTTFRNNYVYAVSDAGVGNGGALYFNSSTASTLTLPSNTLFENNYAKSLGGGIYLQGGNLVLNALTGDITFQGNRQGVEFDANYRPIITSGTPNAMYLAGSGSVTFNAADGQTIYFYDPIASASTATITVTKTGDGTVAFYGDNGATTDYDSDIRVNTTVQAGTFALEQGARYGNNGFGTFTVNGSGLVTGGNNAQLRAGTVIIANGGTLGATGGILTIDSPTITLQGGSNLSGTGTLAATSDLNMTGTVTADIEDGDTLLINRALVGNSGNLAKTGDGTLALGVATTYGGTTNVAAGTVRTDATNALASSSAVTVDGTLDLNNNNQRINNLSGAGTGTVDLGTATMTAQNTADTTFSGTITGDGALVKTGANILTLEGANDYSGGTTISNGTLTAVGAAALGSGNIANNANLIINQSGADATLAQSLTGTGNVTKTGGNILTLTNTGNNIGGTLSVQGGNLTLAQTGTLRAGAYTTAANATTTLNAGARLNVGGQFIQAANTSNLVIALDDNTAPIITTVNAALDGTLTVSGFTSDNAAKASEVQTQSRVLIDSDNAITNNFGTVTFSDASTVPDYLTLGSRFSSDRRQYLLNSGLSWLAGQTLGHGDFTVAQGEAFEIDIALENQTGPFDSLWDGQSLTKYGDGTLIVSAQQEYTGSTTVNGGTLRTDAGNVLINSSTLTLTDGLFDLNNTSQWVNNLSGAGNINLGSGTLTVNNSNTNTLSGTISGTGNLAVVGSGNFILSGTNTYTGTTSIDASTISSPLTLTASNGLASLGKGNIFIDTSSTLALVQGTNATMEQAITGGGTVAKSGGGILTLVNEDNNIGALNLLGGGLSTADDTHLMIMTDLIMADNTTLYLVPGADIEVGRDFIMTNGSTLSTKLAGDQTDPVIIANYATLGGTLILEGYTPFTAGKSSDLEDSRYRLIESSTSMDGDFTTVQLVDTESPVDYLVLTHDKRYLTNQYGGDSWFYTVGLDLAWQSAEDVAHGTFTLANASDQFEVDEVLTNRTNVTTGWDGQSLIKNGAGTLILSGANEYTGTTTVNGGILRLSAVDAIQNSSAVTLESGSTLALTQNNRVNNLTGAGNVNLGSSTLTANHTNPTGILSGVVSGTGSLVKTGGGSLTLSGNNTYAGTTTVSGGTLVAEGVDALGEGNITNNATLQINEANNVTLNQMLSGNGTFIKDGSGTLTLMRQDIDQNNITVSAGGLTLDTGDSVSAANTYRTQNGATTTIGGTTRLNVGNFIQDAGSTLNVAVGSREPAVMALTANLKGNLVLTGFDASGTAKASDLADRDFDVIQTVQGITGDFDTVSFGSSTAPADYLTLSGDVVNNRYYVASLGLTWNAATDTADGAFTLGSGESFEVDVELANRTGVTSGWDGQSLTKNGAGTLILSDTNTYGGTTTVSGGTLQLSAVNAIQNSSAVTLEDGTTLSLNQNNLVNNLTGAGNVNLNNNSILTANLTNATGTLSGILSGTGSLVKTGGGSLTLSGNNTYAGTTTVSSGTLVAEGITALGEGNITNNANLVINETGNGNLTQILTGTGNLEKTGTTGTLTISGVGSRQDGAVTVSEGGLTLNTGGTFTAGTYTTVSGATTTIGDATTLATTTFTQEANSTLNVAVGSREPAVIATNANLDGTLVLTGLDATGTPKASELTGRDFTVVQTNNGITGTFDTVSFGSATSPADYLVLDGRVAGNNYVAGLGLSWEAGVNSAQGTFTLGSGQSFEVDVDLDNRTGITSSWDGQSLTKNGAGTLILSGDNGYTGPTQVNGGTLQLSAVNTIENSSAVTLESGSTLALTQNNLVNNLTGAGNVNLSNNSILTANLTNATGTLSGILSGNGSLVKTGGGSLTLSGNNTYAGTTTISGGTLVAEGVTALGEGNITNNANLVINESGTGMLTQSLTGTGSLEKTGTGTLTLSGSGSGQGNVLVSEGGLFLNGTQVFTAADWTTKSGALTKLDADSQLQASGTFTQEAGSSLGISVGGYEPDIIANDAALDGTLYVMGFVPNVRTSATTVTSNRYTVIETTGTITGDFNKVDFGGAASDVDYLVLDGDVDTGNQSYSIGMDLAWYTDANKAAGTFTLQNDSDIFDVDVALNDRNDVTSGWNGTSLTKAGDGTLILSQANGYTGNTLVTGGTLALEAENAIQNSAAVTLEDGSTLFLTQNNLVNNLTGAGNVNLGSSTLTANQTNATGTLSGILSGTGSLVKTGGGSLTLSGNNTYAGTTTVSGGTLVAQGAGALGKGNISNTAALVINETGNGNLSQSLTGSGSLEKTGAGTLTLSGTGSGQGVVTVSVGGLTLAQNGIFTADSYTTGSNATTTISRNTQLDVTNAFTQAVNATLNVAVGEYEPIIIADTASLTGKLILGGFEADTPAKASELTGRDFTVISTNSGITGDFTSVTLGDADSTVDFLTLDAEVAGNDYVVALGLTWVAGPDEGNGTFTLASGMSFDVDVSLADQTGPFVTGWDGASLTKAGAGTLMLSAANTYTGTTIVSGGTLSLQANNALGATSLLDMAGGTTVTLNGTSQNIGRLDTASGSRLEFGGGTLMITDTQREAGDTNGGFVQSNTLFGDGQLTIDPSILTVNGANTAFTGDVTLANGSQLILNNAAGVGNQGSITFATADDLLTFNTVSGTSATGTLAKTLEGEGTLQTRNGADITLAADNSQFNGTMDVATGTTLRVSAAQNLGTADVEANGTLAATANNNWTLNTTITGNGELDKDGGATLVVYDGLSDFDGTIMVREGTLLAGDGTQAANVGASGMQVLSGAALAGTGSINGPVNNAGTIYALNALTGYEDALPSNLTMGALTNAGTLQLAGASVGNTLTLQGGLTSNGGILVLNTVLGNDASPTDKLILEGGVTSGVTGIVIRNQGGQGDQTDVGIMVVEANNGATTSAGSFNLSPASTGYRASSGTLVAGAYDYSLVRGGEGGQAQSWYLTSRLGSDEPVVRPEGGTYLANRELAQTMFRHTLYDRLLGYETVIDPKTGEQRQGATWIRSDGNHKRFYADGRNLRTTANTISMRAGVDVVRVLNDYGAFSAGIMAGAGKAESRTDSERGDAFRSRGTVNGAMAGVYATWFQHPEAVRGLYVDTWLEHAWFDNSTRGHGLPEEKYDTRQVSASVEVGYRIPVMENERAVITVEPQVQVIGDRFSGGNITEHNGTPVHQSDRDSVTTRVGARLQGRVETEGGMILEPSLEANWWHNNRRNSIGLAETVITSNRPKDIGEVKLGLTARPTRNTAVTLGVSTEFGSGRYRQVGGSIGFRFEW